LTASQATAEPAAGGGWRDRVSQASLRRSVAAAVSVVSLGALGLIIPWRGAYGCPDNRTPTRSL
jgi:hypothetical protein